MASYGGKREGAGRKKGQATLLGEKIRIKIAEMIEKEQVPLIAKQIEKAKEGDTTAFRELFDRAFGKPVTPIDHGMTEEMQQMIFAPFELIKKNKLDDTHTGTKQDSKRSA